VCTLQLADGVQERSHTSKSPALPSLAQVTRYPSGVLPGAAGTKSHTRCAVDLVGAVCCGDSTDVGVPGQRVHAADRDICGEAGDRKGAGAVLGGVGRAGAGESTTAECGQQEQSLLQSAMAAEPDARQKTM